MASRYRRRVVRKKTRTFHPQASKTVKVKPHTRGPRAPNHGMKTKKHPMPPHAVHVRGYKRAPAKG